MTKEVHATFVTCVFSAVSLNIVNEIVCATGLCDRYLKCIIIKPVNVKNKLLFDETRSVICKTYSVKPLLLLVYKTRNRIKPKYDISFLFLLTNINVIRVDFAHLYLNLQICSIAQENV